LESESLNVYVTELKTELFWVDSELDDVNVGTGIRIAFSRIGIACTGIKFLLSSVDRSHMFYFGLQKYNYPRYPNKN